MNFIRKALVPIIFAVGIGLTTALTALEVNRVLIALVLLAFFATIVFVASQIERKNKK